MSSAARGGYSGVLLSLPARPRPATTGQCCFPLSQDFMKRPRAPGTWEGTLPDGELLGWRQCTVLHFQQVILHPSQRGAPLGRGILGNGEIKREVGGVSPLGAPRGTTCALGGVRVFLDVSVSLLDRKLFVCPESILP